MAHTRRSWLSSHTRIVYAQSIELLVFKLLTAMQILVHTPTMRTTALICGWCTLHVAHKQLHELDRFCFMARVTSFLHFAAYVTTAGP
jgi:hypothetical protein